MAMLLKGGVKPSRSSPIERFAYLPLMTGRGTAPVELYHIIKVEKL